MSNYGEVVSAIAGLVRREFGRELAGIRCELGSITGKKGQLKLKLDRFKHEVEDFLVADYLTIPESFMAAVLQAKEDKTGLHSHSSSGDHEHTAPGCGPTTGGGAHTHGSEGAHDHKVVTPPELVPLAPGDRVLAVPVNGGREFVVTARVFPNGKTSKMDGRD